MRRITLAIVSTIAALVLMFSYRTSLGVSTANSSSQAKIVAGPTSNGQGPTSAASSTASSGTAGGAGATATTPTATIVDGKTANTPYGPITVEVTITGGQITDVTAVTYPQDNGRSRQINTQALPILRGEVIDAQSANIQAVSGATYTSAGYEESLQSALDLAGK